ncbi:MAG: phytanoyl-CoA dioxygenase family protein [Planctomycetaceae bacterium]
MSATHPAPSLRERYEGEGFVVVRGLFEAADVAAGAAEAERLLRDHAGLVDVNNLRCRWRTDTATGACTFETFDPVCDIAPVCRGLALHPRLMEVLAAIYGERACLFKDKLIFKPPGVEGYGLHQDWIAWERFPRSFLTVLVPFDAADRDNGCTIVYRGQHRRGCLSAEDGEYHELPPGSVDETTAVPLVLAPGDVAIFGGFTPHRSDPNRSPRWRRQLYLSYNAQSDGGDLHDAHYADFHAWLRGKYAQYGKHETFFA